VAEIPVFYEAHRVGTIEAQDDGASFVYERAWLSTEGAFPISILMPLSPNRAPPCVLEPWVANLLPQGAQLRTLAGQLGVAPDDAFAILEKMGRDTAGALSIGQPGSTSPGGWDPVADEAALERIVDELPQRTLLAGEARVSMTLAGGRSKLPVAVDADGRICIPRDGAPSTHILKPDSNHLFGGVQNEALCMALAHRCGLDAPAVTTGMAGNRTYLLVTRYDRIKRAGSWRRLHQEDFCQALGRSSPANCGSSPAGTIGPTLADMLSLTRHVMRAPDVLSLIDYFILNVLLCNPEPQAKSFSMMISDKGVGLAPIHGVTCIASWDGISHKLDQMIAGEHLDWPQWEAFATDCGLNAGRLLARVERLARAVLSKTRDAAAAVAAMPAGPHPLMPRLVEAIETRARRHCSIAERYPDLVRRKAGADRRGLRPMLSVVSRGG
jgi:serine/threonine-protein kinase HipA